MSRRQHFDAGHGNYEHITQEMVHTMPNVWVDGEPFSREEVHQAVGFTDRNPAYLLKKHKEKQERKKNQVN
jgi:hypothetical protein